MQEALMKVNRIMTVEKFSHDLKDLNIKFDSSNFLSKMNEDEDKNESASMDMEELQKFSLDECAFAISAGAEIAEEDAENHGISESDKIDLQFFHPPKTQELKNETEDFLKDSYDFQDFNDNETGCSGEIVPALKSVKVGNKFFLDNEAGYL